MTGQHEHYVTIIIPVFNRETLIIDTLKSIKEQTYIAWECLIIDDRSTDDSVDIIKKYIKGDQRFKLFVRPESRTKGASTCRNIGLDNAKGKYIQFLDSDDIISNNKIELQFRLLENETENCIATCKWGRFENNITEKDAFLFDKLDSYKSFSSIESFLNSLITSKGYFPIHAYLIKRSLIDKIGYWNEKLSLNDDGEFMMRLLPYVEKVIFVNKAVAYYRTSSGNINLSLLNDRNAVNKAILSWRIIECRFKIFFNKESIDFIEYIKEGLFINIVNVFPELIKVHSCFFIKQLSKRSFFNRLKLKITKLKQL